MIISIRLIEWESNNLGSDVNKTTIDIAPEDLVYIKSGCYDINEEDIVHKLGSFIPCQPADCRLSVGNKKGSTRVKKPKLFAPYTQYKKIYELDLRLSDEQYRVLHDRFSRKYFTLDREGNTIWKS